MTTHFIFFSGKGGVGKTSMACVTAVRSADEGKRTLIVTTDPASNLADVFEQPIGHQIVPIQGIPNLWAMEIDSDRATEEYKERALAPLRAVFPPQIVQVMEEQMAGPCTTEVAAFDRFTDFLDDPNAAGQVYDVVIFDTAPTGHTLRLLELPFEWSQSIETATEGSGQTCLGPAAAIQDSKLKYERAIAVMRDAASTTFTFVLHPEAIAIKETKRAIAELGKLNIHTHQLIINSIIPPEERINPLFAA
ncbi:MAG: ArsA family ATPase [Chloroflexota bacterium]